MTETSQVLPPAGWYPDPADESKIRYWDGERWTEHVADRVASAPTDSQADVDGKKTPGVVHPVRSGQDTARAVLFIVGFAVVGLVALTALISSM